MAAKIYIAFWWTCLVAFVVCADQKNIKAEVGQNKVTLTCRAPSNNPISVLKWSRADQVGDEYLLLYRDRQFDPANQHPSFKNRVDLQDRQMKDGDVSLILNNVKTNDTGTYECVVIPEGGGSSKLISIIYLHVVPPGPTGGDTEAGGKEDGSVGLKVGLIAVVAVVIGVIVVVVVVVVVGGGGGGGGGGGFVIYRKREKTKSQEPYQNPDELRAVVIE
ncbi:unnamed protein product [Oreochromis niloticus]|nr:unnamed protein product [Mustela putorius furo]